VTLPCRSIPMSISTGILMFNTKDVLSLSLLAIHHSTEPKTPRDPGDPASLQTIPIHIHTRKEEKASKPLTLPF
jgi:hypothetical protein